MEHNKCSSLVCGWILDYNLCEKIWQYSCVHNKSYFNILFGSQYIKGSRPNSFKVRKIML